MKKKADWTIEGCHDCTYCAYTGKRFELRCVYKSKRGREIEDETKTPNWCPLEDAE